jgi:acetylornithine/N-succinyldiaminopimelate aminotransferase
MVFELPPEELLIPVYNFQKIELSHGNGSRLFDTEGKSYLDFSSGIATTSLGHNHPALVHAISDQAQKLIHSPASFLSSWRLELAKKLIDKSGLDKAFFANSGAEANEAALKLARKWAKTTKGEGCTEVICFENAFHGRSMGTLSYSGNPDRHSSFFPLLEGVKVAAFNDLQGVKKLISKNTAAIIIEPIQGEGGINSADPSFMRGLRSLATEQNIALILDEVQTGMGRLGRWFGFETYEILPDILTLGKGLGSGYPLSAMLAKDSFSTHFSVGDHGTTLGGNPLACRIGCTVVEVMEKRGFLSNVCFRSKQLKTGLEPFGNLRGDGLLLGLEVELPIYQLLESLRKDGLLALKAGQNVLRLCPPLIVTEEEVSEALEILKQNLKNMLTS